MLIELHPPTHTHTLFCLSDNCLGEDKELDEAEEQVEICSDGEWQAVCGNGWTKNRQAVCRSLETDDTPQSMRF